ncbi:hypothetical protein IWQ60_010479 [Tieghemiomyces parasiticus]|uniref:Multiple myeloma tumor-associated protein 2-like N-terminal domain-containing protein n=1 Tax=Tieghemiomyces parasiticus TaxID=78921 RepID=A0A9W8DMQ3_9FUNG|nr:hypothetical protein IWQ60_010479 [Tieghemiomyces parasiticus]
MFHQSRGGNRGGKDQFSWDEIKKTRARENYLGNSIKAPTGRWQQGRDIFWYSKERTERSQTELDQIKAQEAQALAEALGEAPPVLTGLIIVAATSDTTAAGLVQSPSAPRVPPPATVTVTFP